MKRLRMQWIFKFRLHFSSRKIVLHLSSIKIALARCGHCMGGFIWVHTWMNTWWMANKTRSSFSHTFWHRFYFCWLSMFGILRVGNQDSPQNLPKLFIIIHLIDFYSQGLKMFFCGPFAPRDWFRSKKIGGEVLLAIAFFLTEPNVLAEAAEASVTYKWGLSWIITMDTFHGKFHG